MVSVLYCGAYLLLALLVFLGTLLVLFSGYILYIERRYAHIPGPPNESFFMGRIPSLMENAKTRHYDGQNLVKWAKEYGSIFKIRLLHTFLLVPSSPSMAKEFLTKGKYPKDKAAYSGLYGAFGSRLMGSGLITNLNHAEWYKRRSAMNPAFRRRTLTQMMDKFNKVADDWVKVLGDQTDGEYFSMLEYLNRATLSAMVRVGLELDMDVMNDRNNPFSKAVHKLLSAVNVIRNPLTRIYPSLKEYRESVRQAAAFVRGFAEKCLEERAQKMQTETCISNDILACILRMKGSVPSLDIEDLKDEFDTLFVAGTETTGNTLAFVLNMVGTKPDILKKIYDEVDSVVGDKESVSYEDVSKLEYISMVIKETLRIIPIAPGTVRHVPEEVTVEGARVPAGSSVYVCFFILHRMEENFENPLEFRPERWIESRPKLYTYAPFSMGPRSCIGQQFAQLEMKLFLARFFQKFEFSLDPDQDFRIKDNATLSPMGGARMSIKYRKSKTE